jgi:hypothetical protein
VLPRQESALTQKVVYLDGQKAVLYRSKMNPSLGRNFETMDPLAWLTRLAGHIPDTGKPTTHFYAFYTSRVRASRREKGGSELPAQLAPAKKRCSPNGARLISKLYQADSLVCKGCGGARPAKGVMSPST